MWKWLGLAAAAGVGVWHVLIDGSRLDEQQVRDYYQRQWHATYSRDPDALCALISGSAAVTQESRINGKTSTETMSGREACARTRELFRFFEEAGEKAGGMLTIEYEQQLHQIDIAPNRKSATVAFASTLKMGETFMQITTTAHERLERSMRRVQLAQADAKVRVSWKPGALRNPELYFRAQ